LLFAAGKESPLKKSLIAIFISLVLLLGCLAAISRLKPPLENEGEIYLYIQPYPQEAERLRFSIEKISAVGGDGREFPLEISLREIKASDMRRQRLLASGRIPPGPYIGFSVKVKKAILKGEDAEADLLVPEGPVRADFPFNVSRKRAYVISLTFKYRESIPGGFSFSPVFSVLIPAKPIISLAGYVTNTGSNNITVFDKKLGQVVGMIATGKGPVGMVLDQRLRRAYVALSGDDAIEVIDVTGGEIINRTRLNNGDRPQEVALTPDGKILLTVNVGSNTVSFVDSISLFELGRVNVGNGPHSILIEPTTGRRAYVFNTVSGTLTILDIPNKAVVTTISTDPGPLRGQFNPRGDNLYVIHELSSYLAVIDPISFRILKRFSVGLGMISIKVDSRTGLVYIGRKNDIFVGVYDPFSFVAVDLIRTGGAINYMAIDGDENNLYMVSSEMNRVIVSNLVRKRIAYEIDVGEDPYWVTMMGER
jgi:YVTN family beta-propeller protein